jgi:hypothetical protein
MFAQMLSKKNICCEAKIFFQKMTIPSKSSSFSDFLFGLFYNLFFKSQSLSNFLKNAKSLNVCFSPYCAVVCRVLNQSSSFCADDGERGGEQPVSILPGGGVQVIHSPAVMVPVPVFLLRCTSYELGFLWSDPRCK